MEHADPRGVELDDAEVLSCSVIDVERETGLLHIKVLGAVDI